MLPAGYATAGDRSAEPRADCCTQLGPEAYDESTYMTIAVQRYVDILASTLVDPSLS